MFEAYNEYEKTGTGFSFANYNAHEMLNIVNYAKSIFFGAKKDWNKIVERAMKMDFSWSNSARQYEALYDSLTSEPEVIEAEAVVEEITEPVEATVEAAEEPEAAVEETAEPAEETAEAVEEPEAAVEETVEEAAEAAEEPAEAAEEAEDK